MTRTFISMLALILAASISAQAQEPSPEAKAGIVKALGEIGCTGGEIEAKGDGYLVENAKCQDDEYDIALDKDFKIVNKNKD